MPQYSMQPRQGGGEGSSSYRIGERLLLEQEASSRDATRLSVVDLSFVRIVVIVLVEDGRKDGSKSSLLHTKSSP